MANWTNENEPQGADTFFFLIDATNFFLIDNTYKLVIELGTAQWTNESES